VVQVNNNNNNNHKNNANDAYNPIPGITNK